MKRLLKQRFQIPFAYHFTSTTFTKRVPGRVRPRLDFQISARKTAISTCDWIRVGYPYDRSPKPLDAARRQIGSIELHSGVGIVTGPVIAGNVGGQGCIEVTASGDTVNLTARLQSLTKELGQPILLNAMSYEQAQKLLPLNVE
jgi:hypothetical protein